MPSSPERAGFALGVCLLLAAAGCGTNNKPGQGRPTPSANGQPTFHRHSLVIDATGGSVTSTDGVLTLIVPAGALSGPVVVTVDVITNTAPGGVGSAYRLGPAGTTFAAPFTLTFKPDLTSHALADLVVETQEGQGFWIRPSNVSRDATAGTLTATATGFGDWAVATGSTVSDLIGTFTIQSTVDSTYSVTGKATLVSAGQDPSALYYLQAGNITLTSVTVPGFTCTPDAPSLPILTNVADLTPNPNPTKFEWGVSGHWNLTCTGAGGALSSQTLLFAYDTLGVGGTTTVGCTRSFSVSPVVTPAHVQGTQLVDCGARGTITASWNFQTCVAGTACTPTNTCHTGNISCSTGAPVCVDSGTSLANGTTCGADQVCLNGGCNACVANVPCTPADPCHTGTTSCSTGTSVCVDSGSNQPNGTSCGLNQVCSAGACVSCTANLACVPTTSLCHVGATSCSTGTSVCTDTGANQPNGTTCGTAMTCTTGVCGCTPGLPGSCTVPSDLCHVASYTCDASGNPVCTANPAANVPDGTVCGTNLVCSAGTCTACTAGQACTPPADPCHVGTTSCSAGPVCNSTTTAQPDGTSCGTNQVCSAGACVSCTAGVTCTPANACHTGTTSCTAGPACVDSGANQPPGTSCGANQVCDGAGTCVACTAGATCTSSNPCHTAAIVCTSGAPVCTDNGTVVDGASCGTNLVCNGGVCNACTEGAACQPASNQCLLGTNSCTTGTPVCTANVPTGNQAPGTSCGANQVCDGAGTCVACTAGATCTSTNPCHTAAIVCTSGAPVCTDNGTVVDGTSCGVNQFCGGGVCNACTAGAACQPASNACLLGTNSCTTGTPVCTANVPTGNQAPGTSCGTNQVCDGAGTCVACTAGATCPSTTDPCKTAAFVCTSGAPVCTDNGNVADGTSCGVNQFCGGGGCNACMPGAACQPAANPCLLGTNSCSTGFPVCTANVPTANQDPGTSCGANQVCDGAGTCVACTAGATCTSSDPCHTAAIVCTSGAPVCTDNGNVADGTSCGVGLTCSLGVCL